MSSPIRGTSYTQPVNYSRPSEQKNDARARQVSTLAQSCLPRCDSKTYEDALKKMQNYNLTIGSNGRETSHIVTPHDPRVSGRG